MGGLTKLLVLYLTAWTLLALLAASQSIFTYSTTTGRANVRAVLEITSIAWYSWALLAPGVLWLASRYPLGQRWVQRLLLHVAAMVVFAILAVTLNRAGRLLLGYALPRPFPVEVMNNIHTHALTYWILVGIAHAAAYWRHARDRELAAAELAAELASARIDALRMQLHPHFLFNTMHAISSAVREDPEAAENMLAELANLLRTTLERPPTQETPLHEELAFIERYVGIQRVRFGDRLQVGFDIEDRVGDALVPSLILQPLVENAIEHGIATRRRGGRLELSAVARGNTLELRVADDGPGLADGDLPVERVGLRNTRDRLMHLYGAGGRLELRNRPDGGLCATVILPLHFDTAMEEIT